MELATKQTQKKYHSYALEIPYSKQNYNFKRRINRLGRDLIVVGLIVCLLRTGYASQWINAWIASADEQKTEPAWTWFNLWQTPQEDPESWRYWFKLYFPWIEQNLLEWSNVEIPRELAELWDWTVKSIKVYAGSWIIWLEIVEYHIPDVGATLLIVGCFLLLVGSTLILKDSWGTGDRCLRCLANGVTNKPEERDEETPVRDVELAMPIFKFVKVFPYHKRFSGTTDFSLSSVKMKLIIQFNKSTQTS